LLFYEMLRKMFNLIFPFSLLRKRNESALRSLEIENYNKLKRKNEIEEIRKILNIPPFPILIDNLLRKPGILLHYDLQRHYKASQNYIMQFVGKE